MGEMADYYLDQEIDNPYNSYFYPEQYEYWMTKEGSQLDVSAMTEPHIQNCIKWLEKHKNTDWANGWIGVFEEELKNRK